MTPLTGTEKQAAYAESLRVREIARLESSISEDNERLAAGTFAALMERRIARNTANLAELQAMTTARQVLDLLAD